MKRSEIILCTILILALFMISARVGTSKFNDTEAHLASGKSIDLTDGWSLKTGNASSETFSLPFQESLLTKDRVLLVHSASHDYAGQALSLYAANAAVDVFIDNKRIYEANTANGLTNLPSPDHGKNEIVHEETMADVGELIVDLPRDLTDNQLIRVSLRKVSPGMNIALRRAFVSNRDVAVMQIVRQCTFPLFCGVIIVVCAATLLTLDIIRIINHRRTRGLVIIALFAIDAIFYSFVKTDIFYLFFGNRHFFQSLEEISYILMPVFLTGFFFRGFKIHFPLKVRLLFYFSVIIALADLVSYPFWGDTHSFLFQINMFWRLIILVILMYMLYKWQRLRPESRQIYLDELALSCLAVSIVCNPIQTKVAGLYFLNTLQIISTMLYFIFMVAQHVQILLGELQYQAQRRAQILKDQNIKLLVANQEAETARREAILATEAKSRFLANMSHEIRTPINAVLGMDEIIMRESSDPVIREHALDIQSAGRTLLSLVNDILDFSKIESGNMEIVPVEYEFARLVTDLIHMISQRASAKGLGFVVHVDENIPCKLYGDDVRLRQCVMNLLSNAVKYTPEGDVSFSVSAKCDNEKALVHFEVKDTGIGIKEEDLPKLFVAYERIEESRNRNVEGTGLGMNITTQMLALMGTKLEVKSVYGKGSTFYFDVEQDIIDSTPVGDINEWHDAQALSTSVNGAFIAPDAHILVVDDNTINRKVLIGLLKRIQLQMDEAESGMQAVELARDNPYDLILMDHMMPKMDGIEAMQTIRAMADSPNAHTKIFVLTANAVTGAREMYLEAGFDGFLSKPILSDKVEAALKENLPPELILPAPEDSEAAQENNPSLSSPPEDLPIVDGLDWTFAWQHLPDEEMLSETLKQFYELLSIQANKLDDMYRNISEEGMMDSYRIHVHGMKGLAATVGIIPLAGTAKLLEFAARDGQMDIIDSLHTIFIDEWVSYRVKLEGVFGIGEDEPEGEDLPMAPYRPTLARLEMLRQAMDEFDIDQGDEIVAELKKFRYPESVSGIIGQLSGAVADIDNELVSSLVDQVIETGEWSQ